MLVESPLKLNEDEIRAFSERYIMSLESEYMCWYNVLKNTPPEKRPKAGSNSPFKCPDLLSSYPNPEVLEVGCGLYPAGSLPPEEGHSISVTSCDALAVPYSVIHSLFGVKPYTKIEFSFVERLTERYGENSFDIVRMSNALDHSYDPFTGIFEMLKVTRVGGTLRLYHYENEAERDLEYGMHQWNITSDGPDSMVIWRRGFRAEIRDILGPAARLRTTRPQTFLRHKGGNVETIQTDILKLDDIETPAKKGMNILDESFLNFCLMKSSSRFASAFRKARGYDPFRKSMFKRMIAYAPMSLRKYVPSWLERLVRSTARKIGY
ncbi:MAG: hypothetical protein IJP86_01560 [Synergistaceae bacterium]|nr:hypothetical protein [Synergistaceae bacterium]